jgi:hypothetical protein
MCVRFVLSLAVVVAVLIRGTTEAAVITFEEGVELRDCDTAVPAGFPPDPDISEYREDGMRVSNPGVAGGAICTSWVEIGPEYGHALYHNADISGFQFTLLSGGTFDLISIDFQYEREVDTGHPDTLAFYGGVTPLEFTLLPGSGTPPRINFSPFVFPDGWSNISSFTAAITTNCCSFVSLDNVEFRAVPEPSVVLLGLTGLGAVLWRQRGRK